MPRPTLSKVLVATEGLPPLILHTQADREFSETIYVLQRGDPRLKMEPATPAFPPGLAPLLLDDEAVRHELPTRVRLAKWLVDVEHGVGALVARVIVNRVWQQHFGRGLVASPNDFGHRGDFPSHPELFEWLVRDFVSAGWSIKRLHRQIVLTAAYQRESDIASDMAAADPNNLWLTRWTTRRLDAEILWDSILTVSQRCDDRGFGPGSSDPVHERRAIYSTLKRTRMPRTLILFDRPEANLSTGQRLETSTAQQALWWLNDPFVDAAVRRIVDEVALSTPSPTGQIDQLFSRILQRRPSDAEVTLLTRNREHSEAIQTLREISRALLMSEEFQTLD